MIINAMAMMTRIADAKTRLGVTRIGGGSSMISCGRIAVGVGDTGNVAFDRSSSGSNPPRFMYSAIEISIGTAKISDDSAADIT